MTPDADWVVFSDGARPTEDIYFLESAVPALRQRGLRIERVVASRWFAAPWLQGRDFLARYAGANLVVCRSLPAAWVRWLRRHRSVFGYVVYLIDDDIAAAAEDSSLPAAYRKRMAGIAHGQPRLLSLCDEVVACSEALANQFRARHGQVSVLTPPLIAALPSELDHFRQPPSSAFPWRIGFHGTRAHLSDLQHIAPALNAIQQSQEGTQLEIMLGRHTPAELATLSGVSVPEPLPWSAYRRYQAEHRVHIGLAPLWPTPFNRGKSFIKFLDITAMGGVGIYSHRAPYNDVVRHGSNGLLVGDAPEEWQAALHYLIHHPQEAAAMARQAAVDAQRIGQPDDAIQFWLARQARFSEYQSGSK
ncbi:glycosyltransferase family protein [Vreelandella stevensii]|uniref:glycosyltransferase family protein n=1 Tax=Vreelandella stevensii TaxID=502821 RepID=UPI0003724348|nr:glycosyltransferase [Halomonas stevensii]NGO90168.1 glycosyltransferase [Halomonas sp.]